MNLFNQANTSSLSDTSPPTKAGLSLTLTEQALYSLLIVALGCLAGTGIMISFPGGDVAPDRNSLPQKIQLPPEHPIAAPLEQERKCPQQSQDDSLIS